MRILSISSEAKTVDTDALTGIYPLLCTKSLIYFTTSWPHEHITDTPALTRIQKKKQVTAGLEQRIEALAKEHRQRREAAVMRYDERLAQGPPLASDNALRKAGDAFFSLFSG